VTLPSAVAAAMAPATARVPTANAGTSNFPMGPFQKMVLQVWSGVRRWGQGEGGVRGKVMGGLCVMG